MSVTVGSDGRPVHFPASREFKFDAEVASVFDDMARRAIPMYDEVHRLHVSLLRQAFTAGETVMDVGSSTGMLFRTIRDVLGKSANELGMYAIAVDSSPAMAERIASDHPYVETYVQDITTMAPMKGRAGIVFALYLLQFIRPEHKLKALEWLLDSMVDGGILVLGQKELMSPGIDELYADEYYRLRMRNGYSLEEIRAKTEALKHSMWPVSNYDLVSALYGLGVSHVVETSRWLQFSTVLVIK